MDKNSSSSSSSSSSSRRSTKKGDENTENVQHQLSDLEIRRLENIARNEAFLRSIGLADVQQSISEINQRDAAAAALNFDPNTASGKRRRRSTGVNKRASSSSSSEPTRRSTRGSSTTAVDGLDDSAADTLGRSGHYSVGRRMPPNVLLDNEMTLDDDDVVRKKITAQSLREFIEMTNAEHSELIKDKVCTMLLEHPINIFHFVNSSLLHTTLTHGVCCLHSNDLSIVTTLSKLQDIVHTVYRMSYMNIAALAKRIRDVSRGSGKQSHHKMLLFYYALKAAELPELAQNALKVLQSLDIAGLPDKNE